MTCSTCGRSRTQALSLSLGVGVGMCQGFDAEVWDGVQLGDQAVAFLLLRGTSVEYVPLDPVTVSSPAFY